MTGSDRAAAAFFHAMARKKADKTRLLVIVHQHRYFSSLMLFGFDFKIGRWSLFIIVVFCSAANDPEPHLIGLTCHGLIRISRQVGGVAPDCGPPGVERPR